MVRIWTFLDQMRGFLDILEAVWRIYGHYRDICGAFMDMIKIVLVSNWKIYK